MSLNCTTLLASAKCICLRGKQLVVLQTQLYRKLASINNPALDITPAALLAAVKCDACENEKQIQSEIVRTLAGALTGTVPSSRCYDCLSFQELRIAEANLLQLITDGSTTAPVTPAALTAVSCLSALPPPQIEVIIAQLLLNLINATTSYTVSQAMADAKCLQCLSVKQLTTIQIVLAAAAGAAVAPPAAPSALMITGTGNTNISMSWTDNSTTETGFRIFRSDDGGAIYSQVGSVGANVTTFNNTGLETGVQYFYKVCAFNAGGNSAFSNIVNATTTFSVAALGGLKLWYDSDNLAEAAGDPVAVWFDSGPISNNWTATTAVGLNAPIRSTSTYNGHRGVKTYIDPGNYGYFVSQFNVWFGTEARTLYAVYALDDVNGYGFFDCGLSQFYSCCSVGQSDLAAGNNRSFIMMERPDVTCPNGCPYFTGFAADVAFGDNQNYGAPRLVTGTFSPSDNLVSCYRDGTLGGSGTFALNSTNAFFYGAVLDDTTQQMFGDLLEVIACNVKHSDAQRTVVDNYLKTKYGIP